VNVRGTKAVGEPPLLLAISVWTAVLDALRHAPTYAAPRSFPQVKVPATSERVLEALDPLRFKEIQ
jgi:xanthine dehydrogenase large subunit